MGESDAKGAGSVYYQAAGGVVLHEGQVLLLRKHDPPEVRLPKGHIEPGEEPEATAVREVREEAGYRARALADLGTRRVRYQREGGEQVTRDETYFLMALDGLDPLPRGEKEKEKFEGFWAPCAEAATLLTFDSERDALARAIEATGRT